MNYIETSSQTPACQLSVDVESNAEESGSSFAGRESTSRPVFTDPVPGKAEAERLMELYQEAQAGLRRVVALGLYCYELKERLPHGQFKKWLAKNLPQASYRSLAAYMQLTYGVVVSCGFKMEDFLSKVQSLHFCLPHQILLLNDQKIPSEIRQIRDPIFAMIEGKTAQQLTFEFKNVVEDAEGNLIPRGPGGDTSLARLARKTNDGPENYEAQLLAVRDMARRDFEKAATALNAVKDAWSVLTDMEIEVQVNILEEHLRARLRWLSTPRNQRKIEVIDRLKMMRGM